MLLIMLCSFVAQAQTINVSGLQSGTWEADTIKVTDNVIVEESLTINAGTTVLFDGYYSITAEKDASILALGTASDSITFTVADTTGFHLFNIGRGGWNGIQLKEAGASRFEYCRFQYGKACLDDDQDGGALRIFGCDEVEISHSNLFCNFSREHGGALNAEHSKVVMHDCNVYNNLTYTEIDTVYFMYGGGLRFINCEVELTDMAFRYNDGQSAIGGALSLDSCSVNIDRCCFEHNHGVNGGGLYIIRCYDRPCRISNSLFANNESSHFGGGLAISDSSPEVSNLTVVGNYSYGVTCGGIFFYQHSSPIVRNCIIYGNTNYVPLEEPVQMWIWTYDDFVPEFHNCLVQYGKENISGNDIIQVYENCINEDPRFVDTINENYRLGSESPCIDAGSPDTPAEILAGLDLDRHARVNGSRIDMGTYEFSNVGVAENVQNGSPLHIVGNPITAESYAEIELDDVCNLSAKMYSIDGKLLVDKNVGIAAKGVNRVEIGEMFSRFSSGVFLLVIQASDKTFVARLVK